MSDRETLLRQWQMLRLIPRYPLKITAKKLQEKLTSESYIISKRTVERDLMSLSESFPIISDEREKPYGWSWSRDGAVFDLPGMSNSEALTFNLVQQHLKPLLPASTLAQLEPYFVTSAKKLASLSDKSPANAWLDKIKVLHPTQPLIPPDINQEVQLVISECLLRDKQIKITYKKRSSSKLEEYVVHPLGLVVRGPIIYLVCTLFEYEDIRLLVFNRIQSAEILNDSCLRPVSFSLEDYISSGAFGFGGSKSIMLNVVFKNSAGDHLYETPLSKDQQLKDLGDGHTELIATVIFTEQLKWWLLGFGENVQVISPDDLRNSIINTVNAMSNMYNKF